MSEHTGILRRFSSHKSLFAAIRITVALHGLGKEAYYEASVIEAETQQSIEISESQHEGAERILSASPSDIANVQLADGEEVSAADPAAENLASEILTLNEELEESETEVTEEYLSDQLESATESGVVNGDTGQSPTQSPSISDLASTSADMSYGASENDALMDAGVPIGGGFEAEKSGISNDPLIGSSDPAAAVDTGTKPSLDAPSVGNGPPSPGNSSPSDNSSVQPSEPQAPSADSQAPSETSSPSTSADTSTSSGSADASTDVNS